MNKESRTKTNKKQKKERIINNEITRIDNRCRQESNNTKWDKLEK